MAECHVVRFQLKPNTAEKRILEKRFFIMWHIHNVGVNYCIRKYTVLKHHQEYQSLLNTYIALLKKDKLNAQDKILKKSISARMDAIRHEIGLTEYALSTYLKKCRTQFKKNISSQQVQKEAAFIFRSVTNCIFSQGNYIHHKRFMDFKTISGKSNLNGIRFDSASKTISWNGLQLKCHYKSKNEAYIAQAIDGHIKFCEITRMMFNSGWRYYINVYVDGPQPKQLKNIKVGVGGIDIGVSTIAVVYNNKVFLQELASNTNKYNKKISRLSRAMDRSKRATNPHRFNSDGTIKKGVKGRWLYSNNYRKLRRQFKTAHRQKAAYVKQSHETLCNQLLAVGNTFLVEEMNFKALQKRSKTTVRQEKESSVITKNGTTKTIHKNKKKKRFGKSLNNRAPALFISILTMKANLYGGSVSKIKTQAVKASQYNHLTNQYQKTQLSQRFKTIGGYNIQRDLYSAFLIQHVNSDKTTINQKQCIEDFANFVEMHDKQINYMKHHHISNKGVFGF